jgi:hypothetical protein
MFIFKTYNCDYFFVLKMLLRKFEIFFIFSLLQINIFLVFLNYFNVLILKIIFKK